ncbi:MAG: hypothetical protein R6X12_00790 [bacterium]
MGKSALLLVLLSVSLASAAPGVAVFGFQGIGVDSVTAMVATTVFREELARTGVYAVATADDMVSALGADRPVTGIAEAQEAAGRVGAAKAVIGSLSRLGTQTIGAVQLIDVAGGAVEFQDRLATTSQTELDIVLGRLARAVATREPAGSRLEIEKLTEPEVERGGTRRKSYAGGGGGVGGLLPLVGTRTRMQWGYSTLGIYETPDYFAEARYGLSFGAGLAMPLTIGMYKTFSRTDASPYFGAAVGVGLWFDDSLKNSGPGFAIAPGVGYVFFRTYDFHLLADLRYLIITGKGSGPALSLNLVYGRQGGLGSRGGCCGLGL